MFLYSCLSHPAWKSHIFRFVLYSYRLPVWLYHLFTHYLITGTIFGGSNLLNIKCFSIFPRTFLISPRTFLIFRRNFLFFQELFWFSQELFDFPNNLFWFSQEILIFPRIFWSSQELFRDTFLVVRKIVRDVVINVRRFSRYSCQILIKPLFSQHIFETSTNSWKSGQ